MPKTESSSSSPPTKAKRLLRLPIERLVPHPANANVMDEGRLEKLAANIAREKNYPPLIVRPHPDKRDWYQVLDGHQRYQVLLRLGEQFATCYLWPCDDETALVLLATLNRLEGQDDPRLRAELLRQLTALATPEELALLLPEDASAIRGSLEFLNIDLDELLAEFGAAAQGSDVRALTFALSPEDERVVEEAVALAMAVLSGNNRRGRALGIIAQRYMEAARARDN